MGRQPKQKYEDLNIDQKKIGTQLAKIRKARGFTQQELADKLKISRSAISEYEKGTNHLYDLLLLKLGEILNVTPNQILGLNADSIKDINPSVRFQKRVQKIEVLPEHKQKIILKMLDALIKDAEN